MLPTLERLNELFTYYPESGHLVRAKSIPGKGCSIGTLVGTADNDGHLICRVDVKLYYVHRIVWKMFYGEEPPLKIDHENRTPNDNRISNLRPATDKQNTWNRSLSKSNKSGIHGVSFCTQMQKWKAGMKFNGKHIHLGYHDSIELAAEARRAAEEKYHGEFAHSRIRGDASCQSPIPNS